MSQLFSKIIKPKKNNSKRMKNIEFQWLGGSRGKKGKTLSRRCALHHPLFACKSKLVTRCTSIHRRLIVLTNLSAIFTGDEVTFTVFLVLFLAYIFRRRFFRACAFDVVRAPLSYYSWKGRQRGKKLSPFSGANPQPNWKPLKKKTKMVRQKIWHS